jgi:trans-2,3-dihydro-3-hydroxyanthranilate isomerase
MVSDPTNPAGREYHVRRVDVFTERPLRGNPLVVVLDAEGLTATDMQAIAREMNLSETTFVWPPTRPDADARVRIFAPARELGFAGHPTLGTALVPLTDLRSSRGPRTRAAPVERSGSASATAAASVRGQAP